MHSKRCQKCLRCVCVSVIVSGNEGYETVGKQLRHQQTDLKTVLNLSDQLMQAMPVTAACNEVNFETIVMFRNFRTDSVAIRYPFNLVQFAKGKYPGKLTKGKN